jgi:hypothetical protein
VALVAVPSAAAAAVIHFHAETGIFGKPGFTENDTSQYINMCASDIATYMATLEPTSRPLPPGQTWSALGSAKIKQALTAIRSECPPQGPGAEQQTTGIKEDFLFASSCAWESYFLSVTGPNASAQQRNASQQIVSDLDALDHGDSGWTQMRDHIAKGQKDWVDYDYQVNCLGRDTATNPPTIPFPG